MAADEVDKREQLAVEGLEKLGERVGREDERDVAAVRVARAKQ
jgi:hypothetical protein